MGIESVQNAMPEISVVIPVHNTEPYLMQCLLSVVQQSFSNWELICIDDGSTDGSLNIMQSIARADNRVRILIRKTASGSAAIPRNMGLKQARGKYIIFLDADDYFDEYLLEKLYNQAEKTQADLVMCDNYIIEAETGDISSTSTELHKEYLPELEVFSYKDIPEKIFQISNAAAWHRLIKKKILDDTGLVFQEGTPSLDDMFLVNAVLIMAKRISIIRDRLVYYRVLRPGAQTTRISKHKESFFKVFSKLNSYLMKQGVYDDVKDSLQLWTLGTMYWWLYSIHDVDIFIDLYKLYQRKYLYKLNLLDVDVDNLGSKYLQDFYCRMKNDSRLPFPFDVVSNISSQYSKIAIYGAGKIGKRLYALLEKYDKVEVSMWCDRNFNIMNDKRIISPLALKSREYDAVIIAIRDEDIVCEVKDKLENWGIEVEKIYTVDN